MNSVCRRPHWLTILLAVVILIALASLNITPRHGKIGWPLSIHQSWEDVDTDIATTEQFLYLPIDVFIALGSTAIFIVVVEAICRGNYLLKSRSADESDKRRAYLQNRPNVEIQEWYVSKWQPLGLSLKAVQEIVGRLARHLNISMSQIYPTDSFDKEFKIIAPSGLLDDDEIEEFEAEIDDLFKAGEQIYSENMTVGKLVGMYEEFLRK